MLCNICIVLKHSIVFPECPNNSYEVKTFPKIDILQYFDSEGIEDENERGNFVNLNDFLKVST